MNGVFNVILIGYRAGVGKDTLADLIVRNNVGVHRLAFADKPKSICASVFNLSYDQLYDPVAKETPDTRYPNHYDDPNSPEYIPYLTPRRMFQLVATELFRTLYPDVWSDYLFRVIERSYRRESGVVIPDFRFPNEYEYACRWAKRINSMQDGPLVRIHTVHVRRPSAKGTINHSSESSLDNFDKWDVVLDNDGTKVELYTEFQKKFDW